VKRELESKARHSKQLTLLNHKYQFRACICRGHSRYPVTSDPWWWGQSWFPKLWPFDMADGPRKFYSAIEM